jgi:hypothetical protein
MTKVASAVAIDAQTVVESAGATFVAEREGVVYFRADDGMTISLYAFALRSIDDVELALKSHRERVLDFEPLLPTK